MTKTMKLTLFGIAFFFLAVAGSFIFFVATWDPEKEAPVVLMPSLADPSAIATATHGLCIDCASRIWSQT